MATDGVLGDGKKVAYAESSPVSWTEITQVLDVEIPIYETEEVDNTVHGTSGMRRTMPGLTEIGDMTITLLFDPDETTSPTHDKMFDLNQAKTTVWWAVEIPTNREKTKFKMFYFEGNVGSVRPGGPIDDKQTLEVVVRFDGAGLVKMAAASSQI